MKGPEQDPDTLLTRPSSDLTAEAPPGLKKYMRLSNTKKIKNIDKKLLCGNTYIKEQIKPQNEKQ